MRKILLALAALLLATGAGWAQTNLPPNLVEAARKARAERAKKGTEARVFTNEHLQQVAGGISTVGEGAAAAPAAPQAAAAEPGMPAEGEPAAEKKEECDEQCWRGKFREQREKIRNAKRELDLLQREYNLARTQHYQDPNQAVREQYSDTVGGGRELQRLLGAMEEKRREIAELERGLATLEDDLRRSGGQAGWARE